MSDEARKRAPAARGFLFDLNRCTGCNACEIACSTENELGWGRSWRQVSTFNEARHPGVPTFHLSLACNHCAAAPCVSQCPALAIERDPATGAVLIDPDKCIGCRYCSWVCPYDAPRFDEEARVMTKCTFCNHRLVVGREPACVEQCPTTALRFGPLDGEARVPGFPETPAQPAIRFVPLRRGMRPPESTWSIPDDVLTSFAAARSGTTPRISLASEWPLAVFTSIVSLWVGWLTASLAGGPALHPVAFVAGAGVALGTSVLHLARKRRAWRALLNVGRSWLSREVAAFGAFTAFSFVHLGFVAASAHAAAAPGASATWTGTVAAVFGFVCLLCVDRVYDPVRSGWRLHSADTVLAALTWVVLLRAWLLGFLFFVSLRLALYSARHLAARRVAHAASPPGDADRRRAPRSGVQALVPWLRVATGFVVPAGVWLSAPELRPGFAGLAAPSAVLLAFAVGEVIDRAQFYGELEIPTPRRLLDSALASNVRAFELDFELVSGRSEPAG